MAKDTIDEACKLLNKNVDCKTELHYLVGGENYHFEQWKTIKEKYNLEEDICQHLLKKYGSEAENILKRIENKNLKNRIHPDYRFIKAEAIYTTRQEMGCSLREFFDRRTRLELMDGKATSGSIKVLAELMSRRIKVVSRRNATKYCWLSKFGKKFHGKCWYSIV